jgi:hypothetical protein
MLDRPSDGNAKPDTKGNGGTSAPSITLPKGGGAIRGMGEKFGANPVTGTGSMTVPIATSPVVPVSVRSYPCPMTPVPVMVPSVSVGAYLSHRFPAEPIKDCPATGTQTSPTFSFSPAPRTWFPSWSKRTVNGSASLVIPPRLNRDTPSNGIGLASRAYSPVSSVGPISRPDQPLAIHFQGQHHHSLWQTRGCPDSRAQRPHSHLHLAYLRELRRQRQCHPLSIQIRG